MPSVFVAPYQRPIQRPQSFRLLPKLTTSSLHSVVPFGHAVQCTVLYSGEGQQIKNGQVAGMHTRLMLAAANYGSEFGLVHVGHGNAGSSENHNRPKPKARSHFVLNLYTGSVES